MKENNFKLNIKCEEFAELENMSKLGYKYIAKHEIGDVSFFKETPERKHYKISTYDIWGIGEYPMKNLHLMKSTNLNYEFMTWDNGVFEIKEILNNL